MEYKVGQEVWVKIPHEEDGYHAGTVVGFTAKRIKANTDRGIGYYKPEHVQAK
tara:strand:+ start:81 stop:239 length:159 start_codon:yes stop_codon:yes gene_type:complete